MGNKKSDVLTYFNLNLLLSFANVVILIITIVIGTMFSELSIEYLVAILVSIWVTTFTASGLGYLLLRKIFSDLLTKESYLLEELNEVYTRSNSAIPNNVLKYFEESADKIRILTPDLVDDNTEFYDTVLSNIKQNKKYQYIIPDTKETISKIKLLIKRLRCDTNKSGDDDLSIEYRTWSKSPIVLETFLYDLSDRGELKGFVEVCISSEAGNVANIPLTNDEAHKLNAWFDELFGS